ncbi:MAG: FlgD immunoglobulin-like domain containing protein [Candidatus Zixiibacteriota bacterium]
MKGKLLTIFFAVVLLFGTAQAADSVFVRLYNVTEDVAVDNGANIFTEMDGGGTIVYRLEMWLENDVALGGISLGMKFTGDAGLMINWEPQVGGWGPTGINTGLQCVTVEAAGRLDPTDDGPFDLTGLLVTENDMDSIPPDDILLGGASLLDSWAAGPMDHIFNYWFTLTNPGITGLALTIDSAKVGPAGEFKYVNSSGTAFDPKFSGQLNYTVWAGSAVGDDGNVPNVFSLSQNFPNPFNPTTRIDYSLARKTEVNISVYNILGQKVNTLVSGEMDAGEHTIYWNGDDASGDAVASGIYFYKMVTNDFVKTHKMVLMK